MNDHASAFSIPKRASEALNHLDIVSVNINVNFSIPKRASEALNPAIALKQQ